MKNRFEIANIIANIIAWSWYMFWIGIILGTKL